MLFLENFLHNKEDTMGKNDKRIAEIVVFPTSPFWLTIAIVFTIKYLK